MKLLSFLCSLLLICAFSTAASAQTTFTNSTQINIPDGFAQPFPSTISVTGATGTITDLNVRINGFTHSYPDDVAMLLVSPDGKKFVLQSDVGGCGPPTQNCTNPAVTGVTYTFDDQATAVIPNSGPFPANNTSVRPSSVGDDDEMPEPAPAGPYAQPAPAGSATLNGTFGGINPNGTWQLFIVDFFQGDEGLISGGWSLIITTSGGGTPTPTPTASPTPGDAPVDFNGDGRTDYAVIRSLVNSATSQLRWFYNINGSNAATVALDFGLGNFTVATDRPVPEDYDGDKRDDIAVWRPGAPGVAAFYILNSQTNTVRIEPFGQTGDDPTVVGDYNGDDRADVAVYRPGANASAQSIWFYRSTAGGPTFYIPWGLGGDIPAPGDYDGDNRNDFVTYRSAGEVQKSVFWVRYANGTVPPVQPFGRVISDLVVPGDYDGDGRTDFATVRNSGGAWQWYWRRSTDGVIVGPVPFGVAATDRPVQGDYDGDARTDIAVWRNNGQFIWRSTTSGAVTFFGLGANGDYPVANYNTH